jgi:glycosyltransferase involved in cell wall biosynthesis
VVCEVTVSAVEVSVLVPVYNNAGTLDELLDRLLAVLGPLQRPFEVVCVDDGSDDASLSILRRRAAADPRIRVFALTRNFGSQAASCAACEQARGRRLVHIDADLENFPEDIPRMLELLDGGYDMVGGVRQNRQHGWLTRRLPSLLVNLYVRRRTGAALRDIGCGLRALDARLLHNLAAEGEARRLLTPLILQRARRVIEIPVRHRPKPGRSGHSFRWLMGLALDYFMLTARRPFLVSGLLSAAALALGLLLLACGPRLTGLSITAAGALGALGSLLGEYVQRIYQLAQGTPFYQLRDLDEEVGETRGSPDRAASHR